LGVVSNAAIRLGVVSNAAIRLGVVSNAAIRLGVVSNAAIRLGVVSNAAIRLGVVSNAAIRLGVVSNLHAEQPIFTTRAHVFQIDPTTKKNWVPASKQAVTVSYFYDSTRNSYRIISVDGSKVIINSTITPNMAFTKTSQKFGQWADSRANTVFGLGFATEQQLSKFAEKFQEVKDAAKMAREKSQEKTDATSNHSHVRTYWECVSPAATLRCPIQASSMNGTDDDKISHTPDNTLLMSDNNRVKTAVEQSTNQYEPELQALKESNTRLTEALQEANSSVEKWKAHTTACQEENVILKNKISDLEAVCKEVNQEKERNIQLNNQVQKLENELKDKEQELENLRKQAEIIPQLMSECDGLNGKLQTGDYILRQQAAELANQETRGRVSALQSEVSEGQQRQRAMKSELKKFMELLEGKIDELHEVRQGLSHLGMDN
ncbi:hypothetical protein QTP86_029449, partial [Hemibagrus guttatus]